MTDEYDVIDDVRFVARGPFPRSRWIVADAAVPTELVVGGVTLVNEAGRTHPKAAEAAQTARAEAAAMARGEPTAYRRRSRTRPELTGQLPLFDAGGAA